MTWFYIAVPAMAKQKTAHRIDKLKFYIKFTSLFVNRWATIAVYTDSCSKSLWDKLPQWIILTKV